MRIVEVIPNLRNGGAERLVYDLCNEFVNREGIEVYLIVSFDVDYDNYYWNSISSKVTKICLGKKLGFDFRFLKLLRKEILSIKPDVVHSHLSTAFSSVVLALNYKLPLYNLFHTVHSDASKEVMHWWDVSARKWILKRNLNVKSVTISYESQKSFERVYPGIKNYLIPNGRLIPVPSNKYEEVEKMFEGLKSEYGESLKVFVAIGRLVSMKRHLGLSSLIKELVNERHNVVLFILGSERGEEGLKIKEDIEALDLNRVILTGDVVNPEDYLFNADFFVLSSEWEGMPISLIESFGCGCYPISTPVGGVPEMIGENGSVSETICLSDLKKALVNALLLSSEERSKSTDKLYLKYIELYDISICADNYLKIFNQND